MENIDNLIVEIEFEIKELELMIEKLKYQKKSLEELREKINNLGEPYKQFVVSSS